MLQDDQLRHAVTLTQFQTSHALTCTTTEIHTLVGAGSAEGGIDAANMLKPALARGKLQVIGATTISEYRKYIEKDAALERRLVSTSGAS